MYDAAIAQSVVRNIGNVEVTSSILVSSSQIAPEVYSGAIFQGAGVKGTRR